MMRLQLFSESGECVYSIGIPVEGMERIASFVLWKRSQYPQAVRALIDWAY